MNNLTIRKAEMKDIPEIAKLLYQVENVHADARPDLFIHDTRKYTDEELFDIIQDETKPIFVAEKDSHIVGYAFCIISTMDSHTLKPIKNLYIDDLCVDEKERGKHIGKDIYYYVLSYAKGISCYNVTLNVYADNKNAVAFYEKIGLKIQKIGMEKIL